MTRFVDNQHANKRESCHTLHQSQQDSTAWKI